MKCKDCGRELLDRNKDIWSKKFLDLRLCLICFRIRETEKDPESTKHLNMDNYRKKQKKSRKENGWKEMSFEYVWEDKKGREIVESIEHIGDNPDPELQRIKRENIKELKIKFGYEYIIN